MANELTINEKTKKKETTIMARVNEEEQIAERYSLNNLVNSGMYVLIFMSTTVAAASLLSYVKQTQSPTTPTLTALCLTVCLAATALSWVAYYVYRAESDQEFNHPSSQSKLFSLSGFLGAAVGCTVVFICL